MKISKKQVIKCLNIKNLTIFDRTGIPLSSSSNQDILRGGLLTAINSFVQESFNSDLNQLKIGNHVIVFKYSQHLLGSIVLNDNDDVYFKEIEEELQKILYYLEKECFESENEELERQKIKLLLDHYSSNIL